MEADCLSKTLVATYMTTRFHWTKYHILDFHLCEKFKLQAYTYTYTWIKFLSISGI